jgi:hypothetical protein
LSCFVPNLKVSKLWLKSLKLKPYLPWQSMEFVHSILDYPFMNKHLKNNNNTHSNQETILIKHRHTYSNHILTKKSLLYQDMPWIFKPPKIAFNPLAIRKDKIKPVDNKPGYCYEVYHSLYFQLRNTC